MIVARPIVVYTDTVHSCGAIYCRLPKQATVHNDDLVVMAGLPICTVAFMHSMDLGISPSQVEYFRKCNKVLDKSP